MTVFSNHLRAHFNNPSLGFTLAEPQTGIIVKSWFGVLSQSFPSSGWRKQSFWEGKRQKIELKLFLLGHDQYKRYILQKTGSKTAICVLRTGLNNLHPLMWGSHGQLDDWPTKTQMTIGDHLVGWATSRTVYIYKLAWSNLGHQTKKQKNSANIFGNWNIFQMQIFGMGGNLRGAEATNGTIPLGQGYPSAS